MQYPILNNLHIFLTVPVHQTKQTRMYLSCHSKIRRLSVNLFQMKSRATPYSQSNHRCREMESNALTAALFLEIFATKQSINTFSCNCAHFEVVTFWSCMQQRDGLDKITFRNNAFSLICRKGV